MTTAERAYYEQRAPEYDDFYLGTGLYAQRERPGWQEEVEALRVMLRSLPFRSFLDVACGTGFMTQHLPGRVVAFDQSPSMLRIARSRLPQGVAVRGDGLALPFRDGAFKCVIAGHFYGHLRQPQREQFLAEARRLSARLLIFDAGPHGRFGPEEVQERVLSDGSRHSVYKRFFTPALLMEELGGGQVLHAGKWFVGVLT